MSNKCTLVIGASEKPSRYSYLAINLLRKHGHTVLALGTRKGTVGDVHIVTAKEELDQINEIDTITMYINPNLQEQYEDWIIGLRPRRIIFNPGTENSDFAKKAKSAGIFTENACTLVLLNLQQY